MATTLLDNVNAVADEAGYTVGSSVVGSNDTTSKQLLAIANRVNQEMSHAYLWNKLFKSGTITYVSGQASMLCPLISRCTTMIRGGIKAIAGDYSVR